MSNQSLECLNSVERERTCNGSHLLKKALQIKRWRSGCGKRQTSFAQCRANIGSVFTTGPWADLSALCGSAVREAARKLENSNLIPTNRLERSNSLTIRWSDEIVSDSHLLFVRRTMPV